ncbi:MAG: hypothetical protein DDT40_01478 [candidate division WS2 bacterium]|nr:hypothetical protein [Candidatus Psychracetigena formicireducens]
MEKKFSNAQKKQIEKAREKERIVIQLMQGRKLKEVLRGVNKSFWYRAQTWSMLKKKYKEEGFWGLIDNRGRDTGYKVDDEIISYIKNEKTDEPWITGKELKQRIKFRTGKTVTRQRINQILQRLRLSSAQGRPKKEITYDPKKGKPVDRAGCWFLKGADFDMLGTPTATKVVYQKREEYKQRYGKEKSFRTLVSWPQTIQRKNETLMYLPVFGMRRPKELERYHKSGLGIISGLGKRYRYSTIDKHQRELEKLNVSSSLSKALSKCYMEALFIKIELEDKSCFYIDGHFKTVWSSKNIPRAFRTALNKTEKSLEQILLTGGKGHPLILLTCPGDRHLTKEMFNLIDAFEAACGKGIVKVSVFDREGVAIKVFKEFDRQHRRFISLLKENQHKGLKSFKIIKDFVVYKTDEKTGEIKSMIADAEITVKDKDEDEDKDKGKNDKDKKEKLEYKLRVGLLLKDPRGIRKLIPIITNMPPDEEPDVRRIADRYFARWPYQENIIKDMVYGVELNSTHGYKKKEVKNRTIIWKKEKLEENIRGLSKKVKPVEAEIKALQGEIETIEQVYENRIKELKKEGNELRYKILLSSKPKTKRGHLQRLKAVEDKKLDLTKRSEKQLYLLRNRLEKKRSYRKGLISQKENKEEELNSLDMEQKLYEIVAEKDNTMSNFKLLLYNLSRYAREQWFSPKYENATFLMMRDKFYSQDGYVKLGKRKTKVTLNPYDDDEPQKAAEEACMKFNCSNIRSPLGRRLEIQVEPQEKTGGNPDVTKNLKF